MDIQEIVLTASNALNDNDVVAARRYVFEAESALETISGLKELARIRANLGGVMIDLGSWTNDEALVARGTEYSVALLTALPEQEIDVVAYYNAANGYSAIWKWQAQAAFRQGQIHHSHFEAKKLYRKALDLIEAKHDSADSDIYVQVLINFGNCLNDVNRNVEAIHYYEKALKVDPLKGEALGNKGETLLDMAFLARGRTHHFLDEARRLLSMSLQTEMSSAAHEHFLNVLRETERIVGGHEHFQLETRLQVGAESDFHRFLQKFCLTHDLFLTPANLLDSHKLEVYGDPMFIPRLIGKLSDRGRIERYVTFLDQIKQDCILARYFLVQSQYRSEAIDIVDQDVTLYYPLDYSLYSSYIQMLKAALKSALDLLDKIAFFVHDYYGVKSIRENRVGFRNIWTGEKVRDRLREEYWRDGQACRMLFCFLDLADDLGKSGYLEHLFERRHEITHRSVVVHEMIVSEKPDSKIPRITLDQLLSETIGAMQLARAAVMYLIMLVDLEEGRNEDANTIKVKSGCCNSGDKTVSLAAICWQ